MTGQKPQVLAKRSIGDATRATRKSIDKALSMPIDPGIVETDDLREIQFVEYLVAGMSVVHAYFAVYRGNDAPSSDEMRGAMTIAKGIRSRPRVRAYLQRRVRESVKEKLLDAEITREMIKEELTRIATDDMVSPSTRVSALGKLGQLTHVRAFDPPEAPERDGDKPRTASGVLAELRAIVEKAKK